MSLQKSEESIDTAEFDGVSVLLLPALVVFMSFILMAGMNIGKEFFPAVVMVATVWTIVRMARSFMWRDIGTLTLIASGPCFWIIYVGSFLLRHI